MLNGVEMIITLFCLYRGRGLIILVFLKKFFGKNIALDRSDVDYEAELSEAVLGVFSLVDDFGLSDVFD